MPERKFSDSVSRIEIVMDRNPLDIEQDCESVAQRASDVATQLHPVVMAKSILKTKSLFAVVRIIDIQAEGNLLVFRLANLYSRETKPLFEVSADVDYLRLRRGIIGSCVPLASWHLLTDFDRVERMEVFMRSSPATGQLLKKFRDMLRGVSECAEDRQGTRS